MTLPLRCLRLSRTPGVLLALLSSLVSTWALALPRFAARNGMECIQCHVNPTGGGMRNAYGRNVFEHVFLPASSSGEPESWLAESFPAEEDEATRELGQRAAGFSPELTDWLTIGADLRAAYIGIRPDKGPTPDSPREITSSFFLMQADLYHAARLNSVVTLYLDVGVYSGFEAWGLFHLLRDREGPQLYLKVGRFLAPFGIREVEHQLYTREAVGFGQLDRDTGLELDGYLGPATLNVALLNGTLGDTPFDTPGTVRRTFEKAVSSRLSLRMEPGPFRVQLGGSFYWADNNNQPNPALAGDLPAALSPDAPKGVTEIRAGAFLTANVGRFTYLADAVWVRNRFTAEELPPLAGYATYQELSIILRQGLELVSTFEFLEPDVGVASDSSKRAGLVLEWFPLPFMELRTMVRRAWDGTGTTGGRWDVVLFAHLFM
jgi:hypothetical protein